MVLLSTTVSSSCFLAKSSYRRLAVQTSLRTLRRSADETSIGCVVVGSSQQHVEEVGDVLHCCAGECQCCCFSA